jgi:hypothetical protein
MRSTCLYCVVKHLSQAIILVSEAQRGYPKHLFYAVGHLAEAEEESIHRFPDLANRIRNVRVVLMGQDTGCIFIPESLDELIDSAVEQLVAYKDATLESYVGGILNA